MLEHVGLATGEAAPDLVVGGLFAAAKGHRLLAEGADVYVGDHTADMDGGTCGRCHIRSGGDRLRRPVPISSPLVRMWSWTTSRRSRSGCANTWR